MEAPGSLERPIGVVERPTFFWRLAWGCPALEAPPQAPTCTPAARVAPKSSLRTANTPSAPPFDQVRGAKRNSCPAAAAGAPRPLQQCASASWQGQQTHAAAVAAQPVLLRPSGARRGPPRLRLCWIEACAASCDAPRTARLADGPGRRAGGRRARSWHAAPASCHARATTAATPALEPSAAAVSLSQLSGRLCDPQHLLLSLSPFHSPTRVLTAAPPPPLLPPAPQPAPWPAPSRRPASPRAARRPASSWPPRCAAVTVALPCASLAVDRACLQTGERNSLHYGPLPSLPTLCLPPAPTPPPAPRPHASLPPPPVA